MKIQDHVVEQMVRGFSEMLSHDLNGQNWDCTIIPDVGDGKEGTTLADPGTETRCECYSKGGRGDKPQFRTMLSVPIHCGDMAYIPAQNMFYLLEQEPQKDVNCYSTLATPCNGRLTVTRKMEDTVTVDGYLLENGVIQEIISDIPCVVRHSPAYTTANGTPGMVITDDVTVSLQRNSYTEQIERGQEVRLKDDSKTYTITDIAINGNPQTEKGIIRLSCRAIAGGITP